MSWKIMNGRNIILKMHSTILKKIEGIFSKSTLWGFKDQNCARTPLQNGSNYNWILLTNKLVQVIKEGMLSKPNE